MASNTNKIMKSLNAFRQSVPLYQIINEDTKHGGLTDVGWDLSNPMFDDDRLDVLQRAYEYAGITTMICTGTTLTASKRTLELISEISAMDGVKVPRLHCTAGVHPLYLPANEELGKQMEEIERICADKRVVAVGETGLDYHPKFGVPDKDNQRQWFDRHLRLAHRLNKPLFLHEREAFQDFVDIIDQVEADLGDFPKNSMCVHCFGGSEAELEAYVDRGFFIGISGFAAQKRGKSLLELVHKIPLDRLLLECDSPYLAPDVFGSWCKAFKQRNEPALLGLTAQVVSEAVGKEVMEVARATRENADVYCRLVEREM